MTIIAVGGFIAAGKSSLVADLAERLSYQQLSEYHDDDPVFEQILEWFYSGVEDIEIMIQTYFLHHHWKRQQNLEGNIILDRSLIEHWIFALVNLADKPAIFSFYNSIFSNYMASLKKPDYYLILRVDWQNFEERIRSRGRPQEIDNFESNREYFRGLLEKYQDKLEAQCHIYDIPYSVIDTNDLSSAAVLDLALEKLTAAEIIQSCDFRE